MNNRPILWTSDSVSAATGSRSAVKWQATGVTIDSRAVAPGDLFVALKGPNHDGHNYVPQALGEGAAAALVSADWAEDKSQNLPLIPVTDTMQALVDMARAKRASTGAKVVGITGSVGKTGTKESLSAALAKLGETHKTMGNLNNHIGLPLTLARLPDTARFAVLEMGMNHTGEIDVLSRLGRPHVAIITTVEAVHLEFFNSIEGIADAKAEIFDGMEPNGTAVLFRDSPLYDRLAAKAEAADVHRILSFGSHEGADIRLIDSSLHAACSAATVRIGNDTFDYCIGAPGLHWVMNSLAVLAAVKALGEDPVAAAATFTDVRAPRGRGAYRSIALPDGGSFGLIDESYNASPASVRAAIAVLGRTHPKEDGRRIAVLGDMLELGESAPDLHANLVRDLIAAEIDTVYCCGPLMSALWEQLPQTMRGQYAESSDGLVAPVCDDIRNGDIVTIKGSLGTKMAPIVKALDGLAAETASRAAGA
ncbi:MAG: UDP-N-acetylmuramoylalanyl-D-glutamyl-2,6-diaminopimelate--D-alanyl-D-alanine ligase [Alphaproteobacteria bacterium]|nr:UDP-N-acetylmuramoylalanyl-D-glutamyl-2,6-diaminopimelate--D-alanyl-D-alanine ligase [Alphaproteobacteria bacterium]